MSVSIEWERLDVPTSPVRSGRAPVEIPVEMQGGGASWIGVTSNLSRGGAFSATRSPRSTGERVSLRLSAPGKAVPLSVAAEVRWHRPRADPAGQPAGIGVSFVNPPYGVSLCIAWLLHVHEAR